MLEILRFGRCEGGEQWRLLRDRTYHDLQIREPGHVRRASRHVLTKARLRGRLLTWSVETVPASKIRWVNDFLSNNVTAMEFSEPSKDLIFTFRFRGMHFGAKDVQSFPLETRWKRCPCSTHQMSGPTSSSTCVPIPRTQTPVLLPGEEFVADNRDRTTDVLETMMDTFRDNFKYNARDAEGTQSPSETLRSKVGHLPGLCLAHDRDIAQARLCFPLCQRLPLRCGSGWG